MVENIYAAQTTDTKAIVLHLWLTGCSAKAASLPCDRVLLHIASLGSYFVHYRTLIVDGSSQHIY